MDTEQMMERLLEETRAGHEEIMAAIRTNQEKTEANLKEIKEDTKTNQAKAVASLREMKEGMKAKTDSHDEKLMTIM
jgi:hypothetical protein